MKVEITMPDANGHAVGDVVTVKGNVIPASLVNKCRVLTGRKTAKNDTDETDDADDNDDDAAKTAVTNPAKGALPPPAPPA